MTRRLQPLIAAAATLLAAAATSAEPDFTNCAGQRVALGRTDAVVGAVGDLVFSADPGENADVFDRTRHWLGGAALNIANLEGAITSETETQKHGPLGRVFAFRFPPETAQVIRGAGFQAISVSNNHAFDFGEQGFAETRDNLAKAGTQTTGIKGSTLYYDIRRRRYAVIAFGVYSVFNDLRSQEEVRTRIGQARAHADAVIVTFEGGAEGARAAPLPGARETFLGEDRGDVRAFAQTAIAAGADAIVGHGPHVVRAAECIQGKPVFYSLGNYVSHGGLSARGLNGVGALAQLAFDPEGHLRGARLLSVDLTGDRRPKPDPKGRAGALVAALSREARALPGFTPWPLAGYDPDDPAFRDWYAAARATPGAYTP